MGAASVLTGVRDRLPGTVLYADDGPLVTGVRLHAHVAHDHLTGLLAPI